MIEQIIGGVSGLFLAFIILYLKELYLERKRIQRHHENCRLEQEKIEARWKFLVDEREKKIKNGAGIFEIIDSNLFFAIRGERK